MPVFYGAQSYDGILLIDSAVARGQGELSKQEGPGCGDEEGGLRLDARQVQLQHEPFPDPELLPPEDGHRSGRPRTGDEIQKTVFTNTRIPTTRNAG